MTILRGIYRGLRPQITWGASFANTLVFAQPLDNATCYSRDTVEAQRVAARNFESDGFAYGSRGILTGMVRRIPRVDTGSVTGWEGATGWDAFLAWARDAQPFRWYPDIVGNPSLYWTCYFADDEDPEGHDEEITRHRTLTLTMRQADDAWFEGY